MLSLAMPSLVRLCRVFLCKCSARSHAQTKHAAQYNNSNSPVHKFSSHPLKLRPESAGCDRFSHLDESNPVATTASTNLLISPSATLKVRGALRAKVRVSGTNPR
jgi:hypothetical protein